MLVGTTRRQDATEADWGYRYIKNPRTITMCLPLHI